MDPKVVSQLLAGLLSEPGGSPAAARVSGLARPDPRGAAPQPAVQRLAMAPLSGRGARSLWEDAGVGISLDQVQAGVWIGSDIEIQAA